MKARRKIVGSHGFQARIARRLTKHYGTRDTNGNLVCPITQSTLSLILHGKRRPTPEQAVMLEREFTEMGYAISKFDMVFAFNPGHSILELDKTQEDNRK